MFPISLRTQKDEQLYQEAIIGGKLTPLKDAKPIFEFKHWLLIDNRFPYTMAFKTCHMLVSRRIYTEWDEMTKAEMQSLTKILHELEDQYDQLTMNFKRNRSVPGHFHVHLSKFYETREEMSL